jgi:peroxiredoxin
VLWTLSAALLAVPVRAELRAGNTAPELRPGGEWLNSKPTTLKALRGKVVLLCFWVHSCHNCWDSLPALHDWAERFGKDGLVVLVVHTPEGKSDENVEPLKDALVRGKITWPVVQDNARATWTAYRNRWWPCFYLIDRQGVIRWVQPGELSDRFPAGIKPTETAIERALK